jgi:hypothetical protein
MMQLVLIILTKRKEMTRYYESFGYGGKSLSTHISIILMKVSVSIEEGSIILIMSFSLTSSYNGLFKSSS